VLAKGPLNGVDCRDLVDAAASPDIRQGGCHESVGTIDGGDHCRRVAPVTAAAQGQPRPYSGSTDYQVYCASCHGAGARGDGEFASSLKKRPADLTQLTARNSGAFPEERVFKAIDGAEPGSAHKDSAMPPWGEVLAKSNDSAGAENAAARIDALVKYLQTLQVK
jgi:mono/diheme cytochrome c family protein